MNMKYCVKCGRQFETVGREVICPECRESAKLEAKRAAVMRAKRASWAGESVPVRISGRASTVIRAYGAEKSLPFAEALDALLQSTPSFQSAGQAWADITPYKSHRRDKATSTPDTPQDAPQAAKKAAKTSTSKTTSKKTSSPKKG